MKYTDFIIIIIATCVIGGLTSCGTDNKKAKEDECLNHLRLIDSAIFNVAMRDRLHRGEHVSSNLVAELVARTGETIPGQTVLTCPSGGHYILRPVAETPICSIHGDLLAKHPENGQRELYDAIPR
jgi:hypothetical protein